mgnify:CR=1 FL=1
MIKEFEIKDILDAVNNISKKKNEVNKTIKKRNYKAENDALVLNKQVKSIKSEILVLDQMIE